MQMFMVLGCGLQAITVGQEKSVCVRVCVSLHMRETNEGETDILWPLRSALSRVLRIDTGQKM